MMRKNSHDGSACIKKYNNKAHDYPLWEITMTKKQQRENKLK